MIPTKAGRIGDADRAGGPDGPEPAVQSQPKALIPCAEIEAAAERISRERHAWGWNYGYKRPRVMAVDYALARAAFGVPNDYQ